ncbi:hypothetical protein EXN66_Car004020 [Channa argus]|uniref:Uncharacterized protein n=1 Tax=Channa argus TaxID=215402 RepID=A0A6G1PEA1_CHAAH|nr:hypothetical protein EXN66_Car004020 [Channa argus]KAK2917343.1 hypothetical protein Q8A73_004089 [Channa argus]
MISYVECLGGEGAGPAVASRCWNTVPDEERDELLPRKMAALQPKTEGSLRRRLLSAKIHQHHKAIWGMNAGGASGRPQSPVFDQKTLPAHLQHPGPWSRPKYIPPQPHGHASLAPEAHGKLLPTPEAHRKLHVHSGPLQQQRHTCPVLTQRHRTTSCPPNPKPRLGYTVPIPSPLNAPALLREPEVSPQYQYQPRRKQRSSFLCFRSHRGRKSGQEVTQTTPLLHRGTARNSVNQNRFHNI